MHPPWQLLPLAAGACLGGVCGWWALRMAWPDSPASATSAPRSPAPVARAAISHNSVQPDLTDSEVQGQRNGAPRALGEWLALIEPLDRKGTSDRLQAALAEFDAEGIASLCAEWSEQWRAMAFDRPVEPVTSVLAGALAKRAAEADVKMFSLLALQGTGSFWSDFRPAMIRNYAAHDFDAAAATALGPTVPSGFRWELWSSLALADTRRSPEATLDALAGAFERHATPEERAVGFEKFMGRFSLALLRPKSEKSPTHPDEIPPPPQEEPHPPTIEDVEQWADRDPKAAARWWVEQPPAERSISQAILLTRALSAADPASLPGLLASMESSQRREAAFVAAPQLGHFDPGLTSEFVRTLDTPEDQTAVLAAMSGSVAIRGIDAGLAWVNGFPADLQAPAVGGLINALTIREPELAAEVVAQWLAAGGTTVEGPVVTLAKEWTTGAPESAATWAQSLPDGPLQEQALRHVAVTWAGYDSEAAREWIDGWPESPRKTSFQQLVPSP